MEELQKSTELLKNVNKAANSCVPYRYDLYGRAAERKLLLKEMKEL